MTELTVAAGLARGLLQVAVARGAGREDLLARAGIAPDDLSDQDNRIAFARYVALMRAAKAMCADPALGLHFGEANDLADISVVGLIGDSSGTMGEAMVQLNRYGRLVIEYDGGPDRFRHEMRPDGTLWAVDMRAHPNDFPELTESTMARTAVGMRRHGCGEMLLEIHVTHPDPGHRDEYERIFRCPVVFDAPWNAMRVDPRLIHHRISMHPRYVFGILTQHADALLRELENSKSLRGRVEGLLMPILHKGDVGMDAIAETLAMSRQTLFRRLKAEGTTFEALLDDLRHRLAVEYLKARKVSVNEAAYLVGFSDPAAFSRAFKRWTGVAPRDFRDKA